MRLLCAFVLATLLAVLPVTLGGDGAAAFVQAIRPSRGPERQLALEAAFECGMFDGKFQCKTAPGGATFGKNAGPGARTAPDTSSEAIPGAAEQGPVSPPAGTPSQGTSGWTTDAGGTCQSGMVGTPPNCQCPKNSELLGGKCVHYTASACRSGLGLDAAPQVCTGLEEKLSCSMRQDGLKDCCCVTYDKF